MSKEKQIEEMAKHLRYTCGGECFRNKDGFIDCDVCRARDLYNAGYRKQNNGIWFHHSTTMMECSICKKHTPIRRYDFCPRCGAKMKGENK